VFSFFFYGQYFGRNFEITVGVSSYKILSVPLSTSVKQLNDYALIAVCSHNVEVSLV
jgi:hypothetical protein